MAEVFNALGGAMARVNAGGRVFQTLYSTLHRFPSTRFAKLFPPPPPSPQSASPPNVLSAQGVATQEVFLDVNPEAFETVLSFLRTGKMRLPTHNDSLRAEVVHYLREWELLECAFGSAPSAEKGSTTAEGGEENGQSNGEDVIESVTLPDVCVVQLCDHMQHDQGVKRHAMTITFGADGFQLRNLTGDIRRDLNTQLSSTYWQCYQTNERAAFFVTTKVANGTADLLTTSITQRVIEHTELLGYHLVSSYVTLSPDVVHTSVRMLIHNFVFRRVRLPQLEPFDESVLAEEGEGSDGGAEDESDIETYQNFEPRPVGPRKVQWSETPTVVPPGQRVDKIWKD